MSDHLSLLREAVRLAQANRARGGRPFGAVLALGGEQAVYYAFDNDDAAPYGLSSAAAYAALRLPLAPPPLPLTRLDTGVTAQQLYGDAPAGPLPAA